MSIEDLQVYLSELSMLMQYIERLFRAGNNDKQKIFYKELISLVYREVVGIHEEIKSAEN